GIAKNGELPPANTAVVAVGLPRYLTAGFNLNCSGSSTGDVTGWDSYFVTPVSDTGRASVDCRFVLVRVGRPKSRRVPPLAMISRVELICSIGMGSSANQVRLL